MIEVTKQLTCLGPPQHLWTCSRRKGSRGTWPQRCPAHHELNAKKVLAARRQRAQQKRQGADMRSIPPGSSSGSGQVTITPATGTPPKLTVITGGQALLPEDLQYIDRLAARYTPNKHTFRAVMKEAGIVRSEQSYLRLAAVALAAARLLRKRSSNKHQQEEAGS